MRVDDFKLKAIDYFSAKSHDDQKAKVYLSNVYKEIHEVLIYSTSYNSIYSVFEILEKFISHVADNSIKDLVYCWQRLHQGGELVLGESIFDKYRTKEIIYLNIIRLLGRLKYIEQDRLTPILFQFWRDDESTRGEVDKAFQELSEFNLSTIEQIGFRPQLKLLGVIKRLKKDEKLEYFSIMKSIFSQFLSTDIKRHSLNYHTVEHMAIPAIEHIERLRNSTVHYLINMYIDTDNIEYKKELLTLMDKACRIWPRAEVSAEAKLIIENNCVDVLQFWSLIITNEPLELVQKLEHDAYWIYYYAPSQRVREAALSLETIVNSYNEYHIYRDLVGFNGILASWKTEHNINFDSDNNRKLREERLKTHVDSVSKDNIAEWMNRIALYLENDSRDLATFPALLKFVEGVANHFPKELLLFLDQSVGLSKSAIAIFRAVWLSPQQSEFIATIEIWIKKGKYLPELSVAFLSFKELRLELMDKFVTASISTEDTQSLGLFLRVLDDRNDDFSSESINFMFGKIFTYLNQECNTTWINHVWFTKDRQSLIDVLSQDNLKLIVDNLVFVNDIDYRVEEVLEYISLSNVEFIFYFFEKRIEYKSHPDREQKNRYDDMPFTLYSINKVLAKHPKNLLLLIKKHYEYKYGINPYGVVRLLKKCFSPFEPHLIAVVLENLNPLDENELKLIIAIVMTYEGHTSIFPLVRRLLKEIAFSEINMNNIKQSLLNTGVTSGEYGYAYALKNKLEAIKPWLEDEHTNVVTFAYQYSNFLKGSIEVEIKRVDEEMAIEKYKYGGD